jgi:hypothetical protein
MWGDVNNIEINCASCNGFRAACGNCWGAVACIEAVSRSTGNSRETIYRAWKFGALCEAVREADAAIKPTVHSVRPRDEIKRESDAVILRRARAHEQVRLGMAVHKIGVDEFIYPADTPAKRVWNLATLARGGYGGPPPSDLL